MNYRRGFFRLWLVLSALWALGACLISADAKYKFIPDEAFVMKDTSSGFYKLDNPFTRFDDSFKASHKQIEFPNNVTLFVINSIPDADVAAKAKEFYQLYSAPRDGEMRAARLDYWSKVVLAAVALPLVVLLLGTLVGWIFAGFSRQPRAP